MARSNNGNGSNHLLTTAMGVLNAASGEWTVGFWAKLNTLPSFSAFYRSVNTTTPGGSTPNTNIGSWLNFDASGNITVTSYTGSQTSSPTGFTLTTGSWCWRVLQRKSNGDGTYSLIVINGDPTQGASVVVLADPFAMTFSDNGANVMTVFFSFVDTDDNFNSPGLSAVDGAFEDFFYVAGTALTTTQLAEAWNGRLANVSWLASTTCAYAFDAAATANEPDLSPNGFTLTVTGSLPKVGGPHSPSPVINSAVLNAARTAVNLVMNEAITGTQGLACYDETNGEWILVSSIDLTNSSKPVLNLASAVPNTCASLILAKTPLLNRTSTVIAAMDIYDEIEATGSITVGVLARCANWGESVDFYIDTGAGYGSATTVTTRSQNPTAPVRHDGYQPNNRFVHTFSLSGVTANTMCTVKAVCHGRNATDATLTCRVLANPDWSTSTYYVDANAPGPTHDGSSWNNAFTSINSLFSIDGKFQALVNSGTYAWGTRSVGYRLSHDFFMRIRPKPGVDPSTVIIEYPAGADPRTARILYNNVYVHIDGSASASNGVDPTETAYQAITFDHCTVYSDYSATFPTTPQLTNSGGLVTLYGCETRDFGYLPAEGAVYIGGWIHHVYGHGINDGIALNVQVNDIQLHLITDHGDILFGQSAGVIWADIYGFNAPASLAFFVQAPDGGPNMNNCLFENINLATGVPGAESQIGKSGTTFTYSNIIARRVTINDGTLFYVCDGAGQTWTSNRMEQCAAQSVSATATIADNWVFDCKQVDGTPVTTTYQTDTSDIQSTQGVALANVFMKVDGVGGVGSTALSGGVFHKRTKSQSFNDGVFRAR